MIAALLQLGLLGVPTRPLTEKRLKPPSILPILPSGANFPACSFLGRDPATIYA